jgi:Spy/CpxP family protein refolding chaperone
MKNTALKSTSILIVLFASLLQLGAAPAKDSPRDPLEGAFFPPDLVMLAGDHISLTQGQREKLQRAAQQVQSRSEELRQRLERESAALAALVKKDRVDEEALIAQLDRVLDAERDAKRLHIGLLARIKNLLTPEQQTKLRDFAKDGGLQLAEETRQRLTEKVERVQAGAQKWAESGRDPSAILKTMEEKFKPLMDAGKITAAEAELDRVLERFRQEQK